MSFSACACCVAVLNQQHQQNTYYQSQFADKALVSNGKAKHKNCTVVENGRVVVKLLLPSSN